MVSHCSITKYLIQVKKCFSENCPYCTSYPVRLPMEHLNNCHLFPGWWKNSSFADLCGKDVDEKDCPFSKPASQGAEADSRRKSILVSSKYIMTCHECFKPIHKRTRNEEIALKRVQVYLLYTCGSSIFPPNSACHDTVCVKKKFYLCLSYWALLFLCSISSLSAGLLLVRDAGRFPRSEMCPV